MDKLYMIVSADELELPILVTKNLEEIARFCGIKRDSVQSMLSQHKGVKIGKKRGKLLRIMA